MRGSRALIARRAPPVSAHALRVCTCAPMPPRQQQPAACTKPQTTPITEAHMHGANTKGTRRGKRRERQHHAPSIARACISRAPRPAGICPELHPPTTRTRVPRRGRLQQMYTNLEACTHKHSQAKQSTWGACASGDAACAASPDGSPSCIDVLQRLPSRCTTRNPALQPHTQG